MDSSVPSYSKTCTLCLETKPLTAFVKRNIRNGYSSRCKQCSNSYARKKYSERDPQQPRRRRRVFNPAVTEKPCTHCGVVKPLEDFSPSRENRDKRSSWCKDCLCEKAAEYAKEHPYDADVRRTATSRLYGLTHEQYQAMLAEQNGVCAICKKPETVFSQRTGKFRSLSIDHNHDTGTVRALLCRKCNQSFGNMGEDPERIEALLAYAIKWKGR